jgi:predicted ATPase with chaperone activity
VLFLDELPEFGTRTLEGLRQPLEDHKVSIARATGTLTFPSNFMFLAAMNPCPCGYHGDPVRECTCSMSTITRYQKRISGRFWTADRRKLLHSSLEERCAFFYGNRKAIPPHRGPKSRL